MVGRGAVLLLVVLFCVGVTSGFLLADSTGVLEPVQGKVIAIDPGHGGPDPGAVGSVVKEKELVLAIALHVKRLLEGAGATVHLTRDSDMDLADLPPDASMPARKTADLKRRAALVREWNAQALVSIHANRFPDTSARGAQVFYHPAGHRGGERLAGALQAEMTRILGSDRTPLPIQHQYILRAVPVPAATVEVGFLSNRDEEVLLTHPRYRQKVALAIAVGVARFFAAESAPMTEVKWAGR